MRDGIGRERKRKGRRVDSKLKRVPEFIGSAALRETFRSVKPDPFSLDQHAYMSMVLRAMYAAHREKFDCTVALASAFAVF